MHDADHDQHRNAIQVHLDNSFDADMSGCRMRFNALLLLNGNPELSLLFF